MSITRVAQAANVSYATAWRIINNQPCSSEQAVAAVREAMGQLGYEPATNGKRRGRKSKAADGIRTHNVALLHLRKGTSIATSVLSLVQRALAERNLNLIFAHGSGENSLPQAVRAGNVDGILGYGQFPAEAMTPDLQRIPAVWMMSRDDANLDPWGDRVKTDHQTIGTLAAQHLMQRGHRNVAYMNPDVGFTIYQQRLIAFSAATLAAGVTPTIFESSDTHDIDLEAERLVDQWLAASPRPTGIFVPVDRVTLRVYRHLERRGIQPGRDVEIVSCDNERELLSLMRPAPASIDLNRQTIARLAVERLLWRMKNGVSSPRVVITVSPTLVTPAGNGATARD
ncbi:MAG: LacI family DNA-binding transcriptional regulator [Tepidisphaeraceae bacterium]